MKNKTKSFSIYMLFTTALLVLGHGSVSYATVIYNYPEDKFPPTELTKASQLLVLSRYYMFISNSFMKGVDSYTFLNLRKQSFILSKYRDYILKNFFLMLRLDGNNNIIDLFFIPKKTLNRAPNVITNAKEFLNEDFFKLFSEE